MWKLAGTAILIGAAGAHASLLSLSRLADRYRIVLWAAWGLAALLVALIIIMIWADDVADSTPYVQLIGVTGVLLAAATVAVPILHRASKGEMPEGRGETGTPEGRQIAHCPNCGSTNLQTDARIRVSCRNCGAVFSVSFSG